MFLQLRFSRDDARIGGAPGQATTGGRSSLRSPRALRAARSGVVGVRREPGRRADGADLVPGTGRFPYMVTGAAPRQTAHAKGRRGRRMGRDGNGSRPDREEQEASAPRVPPAAPHNSRRTSPCGRPRSGHRQRIEPRPGGSGSAAPSRDAAGGGAPSAGGTRGFPSAFTSPHSRDSLLGGT